MIPNFFSKKPIPEVIPEDLEKEISKFSKLPKDKALEEIFNFVVKKFDVYQIQPLYFWEFFRDDINWLWKRKYLNCIHLNFMLRIILVKSGFNDDDIKLRITQTRYIYLHQYLQLNLDNKLINLDPWFAHYGMEMGDYGHGFHVSFKK